jgi:hypothetical protein
LAERILRLKKAIPQQQNVNMKGGFHVVKRWQFKRQQLFLVVPIRLSFDVLARIQLWLAACLFPVGIFVCLSQTHGSSPISGPCPGAYWRVRADAACFVNLPTWSFLSDFLRHCGPIIIAKKSSRHIHTTGSLPGRQKIQNAYNIFRLAKRTGQNCDDRRFSGSKKM